MTYAQGRTYYDSDSHLMETLDWLHQQATADEAPLLRNMGLSAAGVGVKELIAKAEARRGDPVATAQLLEQPIISGPKGWLAYGAIAAEERSKALDLLGFKRQLIFPTFALNQFAGSEDDDVLYAGTSALNRGMGRFCANDERMLAVGYLPLRDPGRSLAAIDNGIAAGVRAFWVSAEPVAGKSPAHLDHEPIWQRLAAANVPIVLHVGGSRLLPPGYHNNGRPRPADWLGGGENLRAKDWPATAHSPQNFLTSLVLDGVFQRYPGLRCGVIEIGASWMPGYMRILDQAGLNFRKSEPLLQELELKPSEYLRRQVRVSLFAFEDVGWLIEHGGEELFMFASDYPHPEGGRDPIGRFEASLDASNVSERARERFYRGNFASLMGID
jgi:predicted TIM-barrel fold metal-dependent hydrolase